MTRVRYKACRSFNDGQVFVEIDGLWGVVACKPDGSGTNTVELRRMTPDECLVHEIMSR